MFNALRSDELLMGVGRVLRTVAKAPGPLEEYERSQALSAYSITRLLAAEQAAAPELLKGTRRSLLQALDAEPRPGPEALPARGQIQAAQSGTEVGEALGVLLADLPRDSPTRSRIHAVLAEMIDLEVAALAAARR
jgi:hypothetical protein